MLRRERKTLNRIKKNFKLDSIIYLDTDNQFFMSNNTKVPYRYADMYYIIRSLSQAGYLQLSNHPTDTYFSLTYDGYNRFRYQLDAFRISFFAKWLPGFISGTISTLLVEWLIRCYL